MIVGDLFSGIGGFSLAAQWMGWRTAWFSEIDPYASRVLAHHWPDVPNHGDITRIDWATVEPVDVLTGGFPCQPHSLAGKRLASNDDRDLFSEIIRAVRVLRPRVIVLENVPGLLTSESGRFFGRVLGALAACGYDVEWRVLSAAQVGAPHKRERVWITAYAHGEPAAVQQERFSGRGIASVAGGHGEVWSVADAAHDGTGRREQFAGGGEGARDVADADSGRREQRDALERCVPESHETGAGVPDALRLGLEGVVQGRATTRTTHRPGDGCDSGGWATEPDVGRVAHGVPARVDRLRCLGNSIVPACALEIFRAIEGRSVRAAA